MKTPKENQLKEDFFVQSTIIIDGYEVNDIPCKIYLPENPLTKPRLEFKPNHVGISLNSACDFVPLRPPISLIAAVGDRSEATLEFFHSLRLS
jgi:hypothetical protein